MEIANDAIADIEDNVDNLEGQVTVLFGEQVIQDEQLFGVGYSYRKYVHLILSIIAHSFDIPSLYKNSTLHKMYALPTRK